MVWVTRHLLFQRMILVYVVELSLFFPASTRIREFCTRKFFEHQNQSVSHRQM